MNSEQDVAWQQLLKLNQELSTIVHGGTLVWTRRDMIKDPPEQLKESSAAVNKIAPAGVEIFEYRTTAQGWSIYVLHSIAKQGGMVMTEGVGVKDLTVIRMLPADSKLAAQLAEKQFLAQQ